MSKTPAQFEQPKPISKEEREAHKAFRQIEAEKTMTEYAIAGKAFTTNRERVKAERLAREALEPSPLPKKKKAGLKTKR